jgi:hypothetical protein
MKILWAIFAVLTGMVGYTINNVEINKRSGKIIFMRIEFACIVS